MDKGGSDNSSILIPIVVIILAVFCLFFLWWISYPFILRYYVDSKDSVLPQSSIANGSNGLNGTVGANSNHPVNGAHGAHGIDSKPGANGKNGVSGATGLTGIQGIEGDVGIEGVAGTDGIPGFNVISVRENLFDSSIEKVYYVNGIPLHKHIDSLSAKATKVFNNEVVRISERIKTSFKLSSNKIYFNKVLDNLGEIPVSVSIDPLVLDTVAKFNAFLDSVLVTYNIAKIALSTIRDNEINNIETYTEELDLLSRYRSEDLPKVNSNIYLTELRNGLIDIEQPLHLPITSRFYIILENLRVLTISFQSQISNLNIELTTQQNIYNSNISTLAAKQAATTEMTDISQEINKLKTMKNEIKLNQTGMKNTIKDHYKNGLGLVPLTYTIIFNDYGTTGSLALKSGITTSNTAINTALVACQTAMDTTINPVKFVNPV